jgi:hypothetical protein
MKKSYLLLAVLAVAACQPGQDNKPSDARSFGLLGDVKEVYLTQTTLSSTNEMYEVTDEPGVERLEFTFDAKGRVTLDTYGSVYEYNAAGEFVKGDSDFTELERDEQGRLASYDNTNLEWDELDEFDFEHFFAYTFGYDARHRVVSEELNGWEWIETYTYTYDGDKVYPASATFEGDSEGWTEEGEISYEYTAFDAKGNWTERTKTVTVKGYDIDDEENAETWTDVVRQVRRFVYWSE